jgi:hypothetical protein
LIGGAGAMPASSSFDEALVLEANDFFIAPSAFVAAARELEAPAADAAARKLVAPAADVAAARTLACPAIGFFRSVPFPRADDTLLSEALAFEVSIFNGAAFLGAPPRGDAARAAGAFRGDPARGTPDVPSALGDIVSRGRPQGFARLRLDFGEKNMFRFAKNNRNLRPPAEGLLLRGHSHSLPAVSHFTASDPSRAPPSP